MKSKPWALKLISKFQECFPQLFTRENKFFSKLEHLSYLWVIKVVLFHHQTSFLKVNFKHVPNQEKCTQILMYPTSSMNNLPYKILSPLPTHFPLYLFQIPFYNVFQNSSDRIPSVISRQHILYIHKILL